MTAWALLRALGWALELRYRSRTPAPMRALLALSRVLRAEREARRATFPAVPPPRFLAREGDRRPRRMVRCERCARPLRSGARVPVRLVGVGRFECVRCDRPRAPSAGEVVLVTAGAPSTP